MVFTPSKTKRKVFSAKTILKNSIVELLGFKLPIFLMILIGLINGVYTYIQVPYASYQLLLPNTQVSFLVGLRNVECATHCQVS